MLDALVMTYLWLKAGHIIFVIFWMAGLFMLPRFFVYHQEAAPGSPEEQLWLDRERKLLKIILNPSIIVVWLLGVALAFSLGAWDQGWLHAKLGLSCCSPPITVISQAMPRSSPAATGGCPVARCGC